LTFPDVRLPLSHSRSSLSSLPLTPPSNSWWVNNTEFGKKKGMLRPSLRLGEEIRQLKL
jgi:hypothetical protein